MSANPTKPDDIPRTPRDTALRREREAIALRDNLARRKAQSRARQHAGTDKKEPAPCR
jgi:hypothetical protein